jgi:two-component system competent response regulator ComA
MDAREWLHAIGTVLEGRRNIPVSPGAPAALSDRQISVLQLAAIGLGNRQIAEKLHLTERTVKYHMTGSFQRLTCASRTEAVARAAALGLITLPVH